MMPCFCGRLAYNNRETSILDKASMVSTRAKDWANDKLVQAMDAVGDTFQKAGDKLGDNKLGNITKAVGVIINDKEGKVTKRGMEKIANASFGDKVSAVIPDFSRPEKVLELLS